MLVEAGQKLEDKVEAVVVVFTVELSTRFIN
jgi:hypothetical protein